MIALILLLWLVTGNLGIRTSLYNYLEEKNWFAYFIEPIFAYFIVRIALLHYSTVYVGLQTLMGFIRTFFLILIIIKAGLAAKIMPRFIWDPSQQHFNVNNLKAWGKNLLLAILGTIFSFLLLFVFALIFKHEAPTLDNISIFAATMNPTFNLISIILLPIFEVQIFIANIDLILDEAKFNIKKYKYNKIIIVIVSSLIFAIFKEPEISIFTLEYFVIGLILSFLYKYSKSTTYPTLAFIGALFLVTIF